MILFGDCRDILPTLPEKSVHCCVTSPPYFGLRDYGCAGQIGLEQTPEEFVAALVEVFSHVRRVLRDDGTLWLNMGDSYSNDSKWGGSSGGKHAAALHGNTGIGRGKKETGLKPKDLIGIPWRVAFALQADSWYLRQDIIWHKPNSMPESVTDRCTKAHEYLFLLAKSEKYFYDAEAVRETAVQAGRRRKDKIGGNKGCKVHHSPGGEFSGSETRNRRSVWTVPTTPYRGAHFATFPPKLVEPCILAGCPEGGTVLDPFMGSGTVAAVATLHGRKYIGCEMNTDYKELQDARIGRVLAEGRV